MSGVIKALGLVFGDIGTSPIYTLTVAFLILEPTYENVLGVLSLIFWTLIILPTIQYNFLAMNLSIRGEGGTIVLSEIFKSLSKSNKTKAFVTFLALIGVSFLIGDGVITPAISILSAVEGTAFIPGLEGISQASMVFIAIIIAFTLFLFQKKGTGKVSSAFGPIMCIWFLSILVIGIHSVFLNPQVLKAINPYYAVEFLMHNGWKGYLVLGEIILCATGAEAMYADMGHLGAKPIRKAWAMVFFALFINYFGQGAFLLKNPQVKNILFEMAFNFSSFLYVPFLILSLLATVIASQAMISGMFSVVYQAITTRIMPMLKIDYTSKELKSQIYIGSVNWFLLLAVILIMIDFGSSSNLAAAYGLAVTGNMCITGLLLVSIFFLKRNYYAMLASIFIIFVDFVYFSSCLYKIPHGGYWSIILALFPFLTMFIYMRGQKRLYRFMMFMPLDDFILKFERVYETNPKIPGTAIFFIRDKNKISPYIVETMFYHGIIYEDNIFLSIVIRPDPFGVTGYFKENLCKGVRVFEIQMGYMEVVNIEEILRENGIDERAIFYGLEEIIARGHWKIFAFLKRVTPTFISFFRLPSRKLHGVLTRVEM
ncbi:KUP/HAK/KT family potassium transporter [Thermodesulfovibrio yellowstonii]|uniref:KUP/HAK/KT family potassium transporter n=1 Tax=Thermodesulfovibrio yellowstonii TaxID=28262 RepID=UPI0024B3B468|nr:KUP/HAK/KT family potassium transporter [Thermodesulfovibrio yellowstonii]MDI6865673.1 KUP/HAK/KT family potassium transporter [Thermodesulfovibrio yellowstonii]